MNIFLKQSSNEWIKYWNHEYQVKLIPMVRLTIFSPYKLNCKLFCSQSGWNPPLSSLLESWVNEIVIYLDQNFRLTHLSSFKKKLCFPYQQLSVCFDLKTLSKMLQVCISQSSSHKWVIPSCWKSYWSSIVVRLKDSRIGAR